MSGEVAELERPVDELPDGWRLARLGDVAKLGGGTTPSRNEAGYWDGGAIPWATPSDITSLSPGANTIDRTGSMVSERALAECSLPLNPPGTVLMTSRATIGYAAINTVPMTTNQGFITFSAGQDLDPIFLLHWLIAQRANLVAAAGGSTFKEISRGTAKLLPILLPPLDEQRRIAEVLRSVDEAIAAASLVIAQAGEAFEAVLADLFSCYGDASAKLESYCLKGGLQTGPFGSQLKAEDYVDEGIPVVMPVDLTPKGMDFAAAKKAPVAKSRELARHILQPGDVLFARRGEIGRCGLYLEGDPVAMCGAALTQSAPPSPITTGSSSICRIGRGRMPITLSPASCSTG